MDKCFTNATVMWNEQEIIKRENLIREIPSILQKAWRDLNSAVQFERCETPVLTPASYLESHINKHLRLLNTGRRGYLRPETTVGTYEAFSRKFNDNQMRKHLPYCMWQVGLSFRDEAKPETMRANRLRLVQFYQMEFQLFASAGSKAPYIETALHALTKEYGGWAQEADEKPHYSSKTTDWYIDDLEVAGCSVRKDWQPGTVFEVAIGLDRLVAMLSKNEISL